MRLRTLVLQTTAVAAVLFAFPLAGDPPPRIGFSGYGAIRIGTKLWELLNVLGESATVESIQGGCTTVYATSSANPELIVLVVDDSLARIEVRGPVLETVPDVTV